MLPCVFLPSLSHSRVVTKGERSDVGDIWHICRESVSSPVIIDNLFRLARPHSLRLGIMLKHLIYNFINYWIYFMLFKTFYCIYYRPINYKIRSIIIFVYYVLYAVISNLLLGRGILLCTSCI